MQYQSTFSAIPYPENFKFIHHNALKVAFTECAFSGTLPELEDKFKKWVTEKAITSKNWIQTALTFIKNERAQKTDHKMKTQTVCTVPLFEPDDDIFRPRTEAELAKYPENIKKGYEAAVESMLKERRKKIELGLAPESYYHKDYSNLDAMFKFMKITIPKDMV